jgi:hypothetical protein
MEVVSLKPNSSQVKESVTDIGEIGSKRRKAITKKGRDVNFIVKEHSGVRSLVIIRIEHCLYRMQERQT